MLFLSLILTIQFLQEGAVQSVERWELVEGSSATSPPFSLPCDGGEFNAPQPWQ
jgi:hypothetical protein